MKKVKRGIEVSHWKVEGTDAFDAINPAWTDEELNIVSNKEVYYDHDQEEMDARIKETIHKGK